MQITLAHLGFHLGQFRRMGRLNAGNHGDRQLIAGLDHLAHLTHLHALQGGAKLRVIAKLSDGRSGTIAGHGDEIEVQFGSDLLRVLRRFHQLGMSFVGQFLHAIENGLALQREHNRRLYLIQGLQVRRLPLQHLNDVESIFGGDNIADFVWLERESRIFERFDHLAARNPSQIPAFLGRSGILGIFLGKLGEIPAGLNLLQESLGLGLNLRNLFLGLVRGAEQNVASLYAFRRPVIIPVGVVIILDLRVRNLDGVGHFGLIGNDELHIAGLGHVVEALVLSPISIDFFGRGLHIGHRLTNGKGDVVDFDLLIAPAIFGLGLGGCDDDTLRDDHRQAVFIGQRPHVLFEIGDRGSVLLLYILLVLVWRQVCKLEGAQGSGQIAI